MRVRQSHLIWLILLGAFIIRCIGVSFGLPALTHADEPIVVNHAVGYGSWDFHPYFFKIPPLTSYLLFILYGLYFLFGLIVGWFHSISDFEKLFLMDPSSFYLIARCVFGVLAGTLTVYFTYLCAERFWGDRFISLLGAFLMAFIFLHVRNSHYIYADIPMLLFIMVTMLAVQRLYEEGTVRAYVWAGILGGIATGFKYNAVLVAFPIFMAHALSSQTKGMVSIFFDRKIRLAALSMIGAFVVTNPYMVLDFPFFVKELQAQVAAEQHVSPWFHLTYSLAEGVGWPLMIAAFIGVIWALIHRRHSTLVLFSFPALFYLFSIFVSQVHARYMLPLVPFIALGASYAVKQVTDREFFDTRVVRVSFLAALVIVPTAFKSLYVDILFASGDTRNEAKVWIEKNIPHSSKIALDHNFFLPRLNHTRAQLLDKKREVSRDIQNRRIDILLAHQPGPMYEIYYLGHRNQNFLFSKPSLDFSWSVLKEKGIQYVVIHKRRHSDLGFYKEIFHHAKILMRFSPYRESKNIYSANDFVNTGAPLLSREIYARKRLGYTIEIYELL